MLLKMVWRSWMIGSLLALAACGDFALVDPQPAPTRLHIHVSALSEAETRYDLSAFVQRGRDAQGQMVEIVDPTLWVEGTPVLPTPETGPDILLYRWQGTRAAGDDPQSLVRVTLPILGGSPATARSITIPVTQRVDPAAVDLLRGDDLVLRLSLANRVTTGLSGGVDLWRVDIQDDCQSFTSRLRFTIDGRGSHPSEMRIPWEWLDPLSTGSMSACFDSHSSFEIAGSPYPASVGVSVRLVWRIRIVEPAM